MKPLFTALTILGLLTSQTVQSQVGEIKGRSSSGSRGSESGGSSAVYFDIAFYSLDFFILWQQETLQKKESNPNIISLELLLQTAVQPSTYYIVHPRVRATWGIISTDFRMNYLIEQGIDGTEYIRTDDWQIIQLNLITARNATVRVGGGTLHENFSGNKMFPEWTVGTTLFSDTQRLGGMAEYRWSEPRKEINANVHVRVLEAGHFNLYLTAGGVFQRYYDAVNVWGLQGGMMLRVNGGRRQEY